MRESWNFQISLLSSQENNEKIISKTPTLTQCKGQTTQISVDNVSNLQPELNLSFQAIKCIAKSFRVFTNDSKFFESLF